LYEVWPDTAAVPAADERRSCQAGACLRRFGRPAVWEDLITSGLDGSGTEMNASLLAVLNDAERLLVARTERAELAALDEDAAIELETRIRRTRNKYVGQYRRGASAAVAGHGGRGKAAPENTRAAMKAEAFEEALSRVSRRVAALARQAAAQLRAERLAAARAARTSRAPRAGQRPGKRAAAAAGARKGPGRSAAPAGERALQSPVSKRARASTRAQGARRQAMRDSR
jgi:hypothetical protein